MEDSEIYEDAQSKVDLQSKSNVFYSCHDSQSRINNISKNNISKKNDSSIYQDAQSKITNISGNIIKKNSFSKVSEGKNELENKKNYLMINNIYKSNKLEENEDENFKSRNIQLVKKDDGEKNDEIDNNNEDDNSGSLYEEPKGGESEDFDKKSTIFEGITKNGECCNLPKCFIF